MKEGFLFLFILFTFAVFIASHAGADEISRPITASPLLYHKVEQDRAETDALFSLYHHERKDTWTKYSFGYLSFQQKAIRRRNFVRPACSGPSASISGIPLYYGQSDADSLPMPAPFYYHRRNPGTNTHCLALLPLTGAGELPRGGFMGSDLKIDFVRAFG